MEKAAQSIQDAILTTSRLGLKYLWIDALCIIQDSDEDKDLQISKMRSIFRNAFVTIIAASGENASSGLFSMPPEPEIYFQLPFPIEEGVDGNIYATKGEIRIRMQDQPINLRAWTLEERLLSRRKVIFLPDRVVWECDEISLADQGEIENMRDDMRLPPSILYPKQPFTAEQLQWDVHTEWTNTVQWYSCRKLTRPSDKLRAIGGIAEVYQFLFKTRYLAGLWDGYILPGLLWRRIVDNTGDPLQDRPPYRSPSWSWAAIDGIIDYVWPEREDGSTEVTKLGHAQSISALMRPTFMDAVVHLKTSSRPFGAVIGGWIKICGMIKDIQGDLSSKTNTDFGKILQLRPSKSLYGTREGGFWHVDIWPDGEFSIIGKQGRLSLLGLTGAADNTKKSKLLVVRGIVITAKDEGKYFRVGFFELWQQNYEELIAGFVKKNIELI